MSLLWLTPGIPVSVNAGFTGGTGSTGGTGFSGATGPSGQQGQQGQIGRRGPIGASGITGPTGDSGNDTFLSFIHSFIPLDRLEQLNMNTLIRKEQTRHNNKMRRKLH